MCYDINMKPKNRKKTTGKIITPADASPWPHEERVAKILAAYGFVVEFIPENILKSADIYLDGTIFEIKSPTSDKESAIERNLKRGNKQSRNIVFDSSRMRKVSDKRILNILVEKLAKQPTLKKIYFIDKRGNLFDISDYI